MSQPSPTDPPSGFSASPAPKVSIVIASYGRPELLKRAIDSALAQTYPHVEVIVSDDPAPEPCHEAIRAIRDARFRFHIQSNRVGCWKNWSTAIRLARGSFIAFLGDDDWLSPDFVAGHLDAFARTPSAAVSFCAVKEVLEDQRELRTIEAEFPAMQETGSQDFLRAALRQKVFFGAALFRQPLATEVWNETQDDDYVADQGLILRLSAVRKVACTRVIGPVYFKTVHAQQLSQKFVEVTDLHLKLMQRIRRLTKSEPHRGLVTHETAQVAILLARHLAAINDLPAARKQLGGAIRLSPTAPIAWSQYLQAYLAPSRLVRTSRQQRGMAA